MKGNHSTNVRVVARDSIVLLRNDGSTLPLSRLDSLAIIGSAAVPNPAGVNSCPDRGCDIGALGIGWGSSTTDYPYLVAPYDAINARAGTEGTNITLSATDDPT